MRELDKHKCLIVNNLAKGSNGPREWLSVEAWRVIFPNAIFLPAALVNKIYQGLSNPVSWCV